jgi:hypothetical protein
LDGDYVKLYLHLDRAGVNEATPWNYVLCGRGPKGRDGSEMIVTPSNPLTYYSAGNTLMFQFRSDWIYGVNSGFNGTYRFIPNSESKQTSLVMYYIFCYTSIQRSFVYMN